jgi:hypothetical protein
MSARIRDIPRTDCIAPTRLLLFYDNHPSNDRHPAISLFPLLSNPVRGARNIQLTEILNPELQVSVQRTKPQTPNLEP